jgi:hypothetical protein
MAEKIVTAFTSGLSEKRAGMNAQSSMNRSPPESSMKKTRIFRPTRA